LSRPFFKRRKPSFPRIKEYDNQKRRIIMGYSPITFSSMALVDITPPGAPTLVLARTGNREVEARVTLPSVDTDGTPISGLTELIIVIAPEATASVNPFDGIAAENLVTNAEANDGQSSILFLANEDAGALKAARFGGLTIGNVYWVACAVKDES
jgi:hypothetical protein